MRVRRAGQTVWWQEAARVVYPWRHAQRVRIGALEYDGKMVKACWCTGRSKEGCPS